MNSLVIKLCLLALFASANGTIAQTNSFRVAAASDLKFALDSVIRVFEDETSSEVTVTYGSSGKLFEQISNGAPFDIFFSADLAYPEKLQRARLTISEPKVYGTGRLVVWSSVLDPSDLKMESLVHNMKGKVAIANPQHAPYGKRAVEAMLFYNVYEKVKTRLVLGENISQTAQYLYSGAADIGIIALSVALSPPMKKLGGNYYVIPDESHLPLQQAYVLLSRARNNSSLSKFDAFLSTDRARGIFRIYGFSIPSDKLE